MEEEEVMNKAVDPVCGMEVSSDSDFFTFYNGQMYYFCSQEDKDEFDRNPGDFVERYREPLYEEAEEQGG